MNELETADELKKLCEHIEKNNWKHLYKEVSEVIELKLQLKELELKNEVLLDSLTKIHNITDKHIQ